MGVVWHGKRKRLKPVCHILTITQIRCLGRILKLPSLAKSMEVFMEPANLLLYNKPKLATIHQYLLDHQLTKVKQPSVRIKQQDHARLLIDLIYPGYPFGKAKEQACRQTRERHSRALGTKKTTVYFAYDQLPAKDAFERWEELVRLDTSSSTTERMIESGSDVRPSSYSYNIDAHILERHAQSAENRNIRFHLYIWMSPRNALFPYCRSFKVNEVETWCEKDQDVLSNKYKYVDITDKIDWASLEVEDSKTISIEFTLDDTLVSSTVNHVTICSVWEKSSTDLTCQLYTQSASHCISSALSSSININDTQHKAAQLLNQCQPADRWCLEKSSMLFLDCGRVFSLNDAGRQDDHNDADEEDVEIVMGSEYISLTDPIMLTKIQHPTRSIFCRHPSCFDAVSFFNCYTRQQLWMCPLCHIQIRSIQELYIDHALKLAIVTYPDERRFILSQDGTYQTEEQYQQPAHQPPLPSKRPLSPLIMKNQPISPTLSPQIDSSDNLTGTTVADLDEKSTLAQQANLGHHDPLVILLD